MAVATFTLTIHEGSKIRTVLINQPSSTILTGLFYSNEHTQLIIRIQDHDPIIVVFPSAALRTTFIAALISGFETGTTFALDNLGPVATTTTTTSAP